MILYLHTQLRKKYIMQNFILKFGKYKGQNFSNTPKNYQDWLLQQDWFKMPSSYNTTNVDNQSYALIENGVIHTDDLSLSDATEMKERHSRCFPNCRWEVLPMSSIKGFDKAEGILERHKRIAIKYHQA
jgi:hypothetical protein